MFDGWLVETNYVAVITDSNLALQDTNFLALSDRATTAEPCGHCTLCRWADRCDAEWDAMHHLSIVANITRVVAIGHSAGGQLALFAAGTPNRPEFEGKGGTPGVSTQVVACCNFWPLERLDLKAVAHH